MVTQRKSFRPSQSGDGDQPGIIDIYTGFFNAGIVMSATGLLMIRNVIEALRIQILEGDEETHRVLQPQLERLEAIESSMRTHLGIDVTPN